MTRGGIASAALAKTEAKNSRRNTGDNPTCKRSLGIVKA
jgi:hypothetical protein